MYIKAIYSVCLALVLGLAVTANAASVYEDIDGLVVMEAENFTGSDGRTDPQRYTWRINDATAGFVGSGYVETPYGTGTDATWANGCEVTYKFHVAQSATYTVWLRRYALAGWNDSCWIGVDGQAMANQDNTANYAQWIWVNRGTVTVTVGDHVFALRRLESGYQVDRILLARNDFGPSGDGPAETLVVYSPIDPAPLDGEVDVPRNVVLSWTPGQFAAAEDVYLGTAYDDVSNASRTDPRNVLARRGGDANSYDPEDLLEYGQTYYWRVDDIGAAPSSTVHRGDVWSFTVELYAYPVEHVTVTTSGSYEVGSEPERMIDGSGLNGSDEHSIDTTAMWLTSFDEPTPVVQYDFGVVRKLHEMWVWNYNADVEPVLGFGLKDVAIEYSSDGTSWTALGQFEFAWAFGLPDYAHDTTISFGGVPVRYVKMTVQSNWGGLPQYGLSEVRFLCIPVHARKPQPASGATDVPCDAAVLTWLAGRGAVEHEVYFGVDEQAVAAGTALATTVAQNSYTPAPLDLATTYYWRVVEVNHAEAVQSWASDMWSFTSGAYLVLDDFENYTNDSPDRVFQMWIDGGGFSGDMFFPNGNPGNGTGSLVGYDPLAGDIMEKTIIHGGRQSMPLAYDNTTAVCSEATRTFSTPQDWTARGIKSLVLYFRGETTNTAGRLYVKINDAKVLYGGNAANISLAQWTPWTISLSSVAGNLTAVRTLTIGVDNGGSGTLYIDDVSLSALTP